MTELKVPICPECKAHAISKKYPHTTAWLPSCRCGKGLSFNGAKLTCSVTSTYLEDDGDNVYEKDY